MGEVLINILPTRCYDGIFSRSSFDVSLMLLWYVLGCVETLVIIVHEQPLFWWCDYIKGIVQIKFVGFCET
jgi:hypothetical protein